MADAKHGFGVGATAPNRVYEDFEPHLEWAKDESFDTLLVHLPGFPQDKLKIQITSSRKLKISGERLVVQNKWRRFLVEFQLSPDCDTNKISAKFDGGILYVKVPKALNTSSTSPNPNPNPNPNPKGPLKSSTTTDDHQDQKKPKPRPKSTTTQKPFPLATTPPTAGGSQSDKKPAPSLTGKENDAKEEKPKKGDSATLGLGSDLGSGSGSGSGKAAAMEPKNPAALGGEGDRKSGEKVESGVGVVKRTTSYLGDQYRKVIVTQGNPRVLVNMLLAVLFIGVLALYAKNIWIRSFGKSHGSDHGHDHEL